VKESFLFESVCGTHYNFYYSLFTNSYDSLIFFENECNLNYYVEVYNLVSAILTTTLVCKRGWFVLSGSSF
jgi:hypothetical protein